MLEAASCRAVWQISCPRHTRARVRHTETSFPKARRTHERLVSISEHGKFGMRVHSAKIINLQLYIWLLYIQAKRPKGDCSRQKFSQRLQGWIISILPHASWWTFNAILWHNVYMKVFILERFCLFVMKITCTCWKFNRGGYCEMSPSEQECWLHQSRWQNSSWLQQG